MKRKEILENAIQTVCHDRSDQYGEPENNFRRVADLWSAYLFPLVLRPQDVANMMILFKIARAKVNNKSDTWIDIAGYAACGGEVAE